VHGTGIIIDLSSKPVNRIEISLDWQHAIRDIRRFESQQSLTHEEISNLMKILKNGEGNRSKFLVKLLGKIE
jgi:sulfatase maturation enzyme AslB (radical SAM superfamily)